MFPALSFGFFRDRPGVIGRLPSGHILPLKARIWLMWPPRTAQPSRREPRCARCSARCAHLFSGKPPYPPTCFRGDPQYAPITESNRNHGVKRSHHTGGPPTPWRIARPVSRICRNLSLLHREVRPGKGLQGMGGVLPAGEPVIGRGHRFFALRLRVSAGPGG